VALSFYTYEGYNHADATLDEEGSSATVDTYSPGMSHCMTATALLIPISFLMGAWWKFPELADFWLSTLVPLS